MIDTIQQLCHLLAQEPLTRETVADFLGHPVNENGALVVQPHDEGFREATIYAENGNDTPDVVKLFPADGQQLWLSELRAALTHVEDAALPLSRPKRIMFYVDFPDRPLTCAVIVMIKCHGDDGLVQCISIKRDIELE